MNLDQITTNFNIESSSVRELHADCKMRGISETCKKEMDLIIRYWKPVQKEEKKYGGLLLELDVKIHAEDPEEEPDKIHLSLEGVFSSPASAISDEVFEELLNINGGAALYAIARSKMETISATVYQSGKVLLPMVNIIQYFEEKSKEQGSDA